MSRSYSPAELTHLQDRTGVRPRLLVWIRAKRRDTGAEEPAGFWNGDDDQSFAVEGSARTYHGAGALLGMDNLTIETGLTVRRISVWLATADPAVIEAVMAYDIRLAPVQIHRVLTHPLSHQPIAPPHRIWKGWVDGAPRVTGKKGLAGGRITLQVASAAMALTKGLPDRYSDEAMRLRGNDRLFRYADISGKVPVYWGEQKYETAAPASGAGSAFAPGGSGSSPFFGGRS